MLLINCKDELELKWMKIDLAAAGVNNDNANSDNIIFN